MLLSTWQIIIVEFLREFFFLFISVDDVWFSFYRSHKMFFQCSWNRSWLTLRFALPSIEEKSNKEFIIFSSIRAEREQTQLSADNMPYFTVWLNEMLPTQRWDRSLLSTDFRSRLNAYRYSGQSKHQLPKYFLLEFKYVVPCFVFVFFASIC